MGTMTSIVKRDWPFEQLILGSRWQQPSIIWVVFCEILSKNFCRKMQNLGIEKLFQKI